MSDESDVREVSSPSPTDTAPLLSVVIPTCRRPESLARCLERLVPGAQTLPFDRYEVIVTDDTPAAETVAEAHLGERFPWVRDWCRGPGRGPAANRNRGVEAARAPWIVFTDDDCLPESGWLSAFADTITGSIASGEDTNGVWEGKTTCVTGPLTGPLQEAPLNLTGGCLWSCNFCIRRSLFTRLGGFDEVFPIAHMEDVDFRDRLHRCGETTIFVPTAVVDHPVKQYGVHTHFGRYAESEAIYWYKQGNTGSLSGTFFWNLLRSRAAWVLGRNGGSAATPARDRWIAARIALREIGYAVVHWRRWEAQYRRR